MTRILAIDPTTRGIGFAVLENDPLLLVDWGVLTCREGLKKRCLGRLANLIERYRPDVLVCEEIQARHSSGRKRFNEWIRQLVTSMGLPMKTVTREDVQLHFFQYGATTKEEIAKVVAESFPELRSQLPTHREQWMSEDYRMSVFDALTIALVARSGNWVSGDK